MSNRLPVNYFSDVLCVWAYINEWRYDEVETNLGGDLDIQLHFLPNFASVHAKIESGWGQRGGFEGYANHVREVAASFEVPVHSDTWINVRPTTSMIPHAVIKGAVALHGVAKARMLAKSLRVAFFQRGEDISQLDIIQTVVVALGLDWQGLYDRFLNGEALAELNLDFNLAKDYQISVSPAWVFNEGRQKLIGNVGYRVIEANLKELIDHKPSAHAWC